MHTHTIRMLMILQIEDFAQKKEKEKEKRQAIEHTLSTPILFASIKKVIFSERGDAKRMYHSILWEACALQNLRQRLQSFSKQENFDDVILAGDSLHEFQLIKTALDTSFKIKEL